VRNISRVAAFLIAAALLPACIVGPASPTTGGGSGSPSGSPSGGSSALAGTWSGHWSNDGDHSLTFVVNSSGKVTGGTLIHPGGASDTVTGGSLSLAGSTVNGNLVFNGYFQSASFIFSPGTYSAGSITGSLVPATPLSTTLMSAGGPVYLTK
jgi:hypothetical protein